MRIVSVRRLLGSALIAVVISINDARADDAARQAIQKALKTQLEVPAYRLNTSCLDNVKFNTHDVITEIVNPDKVHTVQKWNGSLNSEAFTDGRRLLIRDREAGEFKEQTADAAAKIKELRDNALLGEPGKDDDVRQKGADPQANDPPGYVLRDHLRIRSFDHGHTAGALVFWYQVLAFLVLTSYFLLWRPRLWRCGGRRRIRGHA